jgi:two-component sensor histidine kinase
MDDTPIDRPKGREAELEELRHELERRGRSNLQLILSLVKLQEEYPPSTAAAALARVSGQIQILSSVYDESIEGDEIVGIAAWCKAFVSSIAQSLVQPGIIAFSAGASAASMLRRDAQSLGFALVELVVDASERARLASRPTRVEVALSEDGDSRVTLSIRDDQPSIGIPRLAAILVELIDGSLREKKGAKQTERELVFKASRA